LHVAFRALDTCSLHLAVYLISAQKLNCSLPLTAMLPNSRPVYSIEHITDHKLL